MVIGLEDLDQQTLNKLKYGWSKRGGANQGLVKENIDVEWTCQSCATKQAKEIPAFMFEFADREFVRICPRCENLKLRFNVKDFFELLKYSRT